MDRAFQFVNAPVSQGSRLLLPDAALLACAIRAPVSPHPKAAILTLPILEGAGHILTLRNSRFDTRFPRVTVLCKLREQLTLTTPSHPRLAVHFLFYTLNPTHHNV